MTTYAVTWGLDERIDDTYRAEVRSPDELDQVLDAIAATRGDDGAPYVVTIAADHDVDAHQAIQLGVGHPDRAVLMCYGDDGGYGFDPELPLWPEPIPFDYNGEATDYKPTRTRLTPETVRAAAREYVATGRQPAGLRLDPDA